MIRRAIWLWAAIITVAATVPCQAQRTADGIPLYVTGQFALGPPFVPRPFRLQIAGRRDGTVELLLESVPRLRFPVPWLVTAKGQAMPEPARTRVILPPDSARRMATRLDSVMGYRIVGGAKPHSILRFESIRGSDTLMHIEMHEVYEPPPMRDTTASVTMSGCMHWPETPVGWLSTGFDVRTKIDETRRLSAALRDAADWASRFPPRPPLDERAEISAAEAGCPTRPISGNAIPPYSVAPAAPGPQRVHIDAVVDTAGRLEVAGVLFGDPALARVARATLETWRFHPAIHASGRLARQKIHVEVLFTVAEPETQAEENALLAAAAAHGADILVIAVAPGSWRVSSLPALHARRYSDGHDRELLQRVHVGSPAWYVH